ncbi:respiratory nitrate reductase beta subunit [Rhodococcus sp. OK611]|uniref:nitrate reductase subunit beta n=1 Tax=unclassified Rhodococcus (in: high G+C Gram-positive bacteria) TaxID=192944 RepID=UPI000BC6E7AE|nr:MULTISPECIES: nitrate reductase subunit beta [unclassified Rhodococcus (in: high G+C Gram-positive bacteria)]PTR45421.1 respiratory nitrate reductase beta subunit [Rhodococcus sp. OK611]SNX88971.1 respiratory nitrate reductase beta subunit [Rhodococcus sp. OK270]
MRVMAQMAMVMNLDKCIGCHTCSVTCKQAWTNRGGVEYAWFNNVETRPGQGYPRQYQDQEKWKGGWTLNKRGQLTLRTGSRLKRLLNIFANPDLPTVSDYYEPWTYDYENLLASPAMDTVPVARPKSLLTGEDTKVTWGANWDDDLGSGPEQVGKDPLLAKVSTKVKLEFEQTFMFYLPRICEHCLNPACAASCPSGAIYKRSEDGIVLVDQDKCRGWRQCVTGCPYKKIYFNHKTGKAEKCTFCYPRIEVGIPTICSETCVGRLRYIGVMLYDADAVLEAASVTDDKDLYPSQLGVFLNPHDPRVVAEAERAGISAEFIEAAQNSPVYKLIVDYQVALPLHPEYRTMPMVWYIPPLSPMVEALSDTGHDGEEADNLFGAIDSLRIPVEYLAELFTAGEIGPVRASLQRLAAMRAHMRRVNLGEPTRPEVANAVRLTETELESMYRLLAIAKYEDRYVIPNGAGSDAHRLDALATGCSLEGDGGPGMTAFDVMADKFHLTEQAVDTNSGAAPDNKSGRINLLNWDGKSTRGLIPAAAGFGTGPGAGIPTPGSDGA